MAVVEGPPRGGAVPGPDRGTGHAPPDLRIAAARLHPQLLAAVPVAEPGRHIDTSLIEGEIPSPVRPSSATSRPSFPWPSSRPATWSPARPDSLTSAHSPSLEATMHFLSKTFSATALAWPWAPPCPPRRRRHAQRGHQPGSGQLGPYRHLRDLLGLGGRQPVRRPDHARRRPEAATRPGHQVGNTWTTTSACASRCARASSSITASPSTPRP